MDLESKNAALQSELEAITPLSHLRRDQDPAVWLPSTSPRYELESHREGINCISFHPTFSSIASGSDDCTVKVWDWELGELERTLKGHTRAVRGIEYGGPRDNVLLASCGADLSIKLWKPADDYQNIRTLQGHEHIVSAVRFMPSGDMLVSASRDTDIRIWDVATGYCVKRLSSHTSWVRDVCLSFDGRFLFSAGDDRTACLWDISTISNPELKRTMVGHENYNECCAFAPPASYQFLAPLAGFGKRLSMSMSTHGADFMATGSRDKTIKVWDSRGVCLMTLVGHDNWVHGLVFHPGGKYLLSVSDDRTLKCWDLSQQGKCVKTIQAHDNFVTCLRWAPGTAKKGNSPGEENDSTDIRCVIATGSADRKLRVFAG
jgi:platelet-activating factor acetylhydrolase IB subunit alpha